MIWGASTKPLRTKKTSTLAIANASANGLQRRVGGQIAEAFASANAAAPTQEVERGAALHFGAVYTNGALTGPPASANRTTNAAKSTQARWLPRGL